MEDSLANVTPDYAPAVPAEPFGYDPVDAVGSVWNLRFFKKTAERAITTFVSALGGAVILENFSVVSDFVEYDWKGAVVAAMAAKGAVVMAFATRMKGDKSSASWTS